jgi:diaminobutyrate-2-oxoglutarate transaminase
VQGEGAVVPARREFAQRVRALTRELDIPLMAIISYDERLDVWAPGAHTGTFRGNQLAFATGAEAVRIMRRDDVLGNVCRRGDQVADRLSGLEANPWVREVRGLGLMWGIELADPRTGRPASRPGPSRPGRCARGSSWSWAAATTASCGCCPR